MNSGLVLCFAHTKKKDKKGGKRILKKGKKDKKGEKRINLVCLFPSRGNLGLGSAPGSAQARLCKIWDGKEPRVGRRGGKSWGREKVEKRRKKVGKRRKNGGKNEEKGGKRRKNEENGGKGRKRWKKGAKMWKERRKNGEKGRKRRKREGKAARGEPMGLENPEGRWEPLVSGIWGILGAPEELGCGRRSSGRAPGGEFRVGNSKLGVLSWELKSSKWRIPT